MIGSFLKSPAGKALILLVFVGGLAGYILWPRHFVDIPIDAAAFDEARDGAAGG